jgi:hypothetical protein
VNRTYISRFVLLVLLLFPVSLFAQGIVLKGYVTDPQGNALPGASIKVAIHSGSPQPPIVNSGADGHFQIKLATAGNATITVNADGFRPITRAINVRVDINPQLEISMTQLSLQQESVSVTADVNDQDVLTPDPAMRVFVRDDLLDANPGRPGAPVSIPGW